MKAQRRTSIHKRFFRIPVCLALAGVLLCACAPREAAAPVKTEEAPAFFTPCAAATGFGAAPATPAPVPESTPLPTPEPTLVPEPFVPRDLPEDMRLHRAFTETEMPSVFLDMRDGQYVAYGSVGGTKGAFLSDAEGHVPDGASPADRICAVPAYTPTDRPKQEGYLKLVVYVPTQSVVAFRSVGGEWLVERVMRCSSGRNRSLTPYGTYAVYNKYELKRLGGKGDYHYGQYATRFYNGYLFHSAPISFDAGEDMANARRMMEMEEYEKLGTPASAGCIRLTVADAKWIHDNSVFYDTRVVISKEAGPEAPEVPAVIWEAPYTDENGLGWDPTDPDAENPYLLLEDYRPGEAEPSPAERERARLSAGGQ